MSYSIFGLGHNVLFFKNVGTALHYSCSASKRLDHFDEKWLPQCGLGVEKYQGGQYLDGVEVSRLSHGRALSYHVSAPGSIPGVGRNCCSSRHCDE